MVHRSYSPDLALCDFFPFGYIKEKLKGMSFSDQIDRIDGVQGPIETVSHETRFRVFAEWKERLQNCIVTGREYQE
jgi:hypothetical protein